MHSSQTRKMFVTMHCRLTDGYFSSQSLLKKIQKQNTLFLSILKKYASLSYKQHLTSIITGYFQLTSLTMHLPTIPTKITLPIMLIFSFISQAYSYSFSLFLDCYS